MAPSFSDFVEFLRSQFFERIPVPEKDCSGKIVCITGANTGLGKEAARHYVRLGAAKVIIACRTASKGEDAKKDIEATTGRNGVVDVWQLDLASYDSVKAFAKRLDTLPRLDTLIENAGIATPNFELVGGNESTITVNVVSTFLLALLALPILKRTAQQHSIRPTLTIVSSEVHMFTSFPDRNASEIIKTLNDPAKADMADRYNVSKLLEVLVCRELASNELKHYPVTLNYINPGFCHSGLTRDAAGMQALALKLMKAILARTTEEGSRTLVHAGLAGKEAHGEYMTNARVGPPSAFVRSDEGKVAQTRVWRELAARLEDIQPNITSIKA